MKTSHGIAARPGAWLALGMALCFSPLVARSAVPCGSTLVDPQRQWARSPGLDTRLFGLIVGGYHTGYRKGYTVTLTDRYGRLVSLVEDGLARTACDPGGERRFTVHTETPWGSNSKIITAAAVIKAAEDYGVDLDDLLMNYLPYRWRAETDPRFMLGENAAGGVTLRMMLQHRGGFHHSKCDGRSARLRWSDGDMGGCAADPPPPEIGVRKYMNASAGYYNWALAYMIRPTEMMLLESSLLNASNADYDAAIQNATSEIYRDYVNQEVLAPAGVVGSCNMSEISAGNASGNYTRWFSGVADTHGTLPHDANNECAAGAWILSSAEMSRFLHTLRHTDHILSREGYAMMEASQLESLGWHRQDHWDMRGPAYTHNGIWEGTRADTQALPGGFVATYVHNSGAYGEYDVTGGSSLRWAFEQARRKALVRAATVVLQ